MIKPRWVLLMASVGAMLFLYAPVFLLIIFSFNASPMSVRWEGLSFQWYLQLLGDHALFEATQNSLLIALTSTVCAVIMGTGAAMVLERRAVRGVRFLNAALVLPLVIPEILMGVSLLLFFVMIQVPLGLITVMIGHIAFNLPLVILVIRMRLRKLDPLLEEAARDLGASAWQTFRWVTLPLLRPAIIGSALMAFTISLDDFVVTFFTAGPGATTLPLKVFSMIKTGITPEINALSAVLVMVSMALIGLALILQGKPIRQKIEGSYQG
ncbi:MAG: ABC transporter permease [Nitrospirota bacterium]|nr:MAG: ABC transporter permease [Nitrospirota bacterium]